MSYLGILVVEDSQNWREALKQILPRLGGDVHVDSASNYKDALNYVKKEKYDLIIVDLALNEDWLDPQNADNHGMELLQVIRDSQHNNDCGLIVLTAYGSIPRTKKALIDYAVYDFIEKDKFDARQFIEITRAAIRDTRLYKAKAKAKARLYLTITFNQEYLIGSELTGPDRHIVYPTTSQQHLELADIISRTNKLNTLLLDEGADVWQHEVQFIGRTIYNTLFKEQDFQKGLITARALAQHPSDLWLQFNGAANDLSIPFELLYDGDDYLGRTHILTRRLMQTGPTLLRKTEPFHIFLTDLLKRREILRILIVGTDSDSGSSVAGREATSLKLAIESDLLQLGINYEITMLLGVDASYAKVSQALRSGGYHIFHYTGHDLFHDEIPEISGLVLYSGNDLHILSSVELNALVRHTDLQLVFLSCCLGARNASQTDWGDAQSMLEAVASADVPTVLGYRWLVPNGAAMHLAQVFFETLWRTFSPSEALLEARVKSALRTRGQVDATWMSPVLVMQNF